MSDTLAILGGDPIRHQPYPEHTTMIDTAEEEQVLEVLKRGHLSGFSARPGERFLGGPKVQELEKAFARHFNVKHAVSFNSATSALHGIISASKVGPGDEVIVSPFTMSATACAIVMQNAVPVFADIDDRTFGLDPESVRQKITSKTRAILTVNIFGHPSNLEALKKLAWEHKLILLEDNAQSPGALMNEKFTGTIGEMGVLSLNYHKLIQTGEGGIAITDSDAHADHLRLVRNHGEVVIGKLPDYTPEDLVNMVGWNYRLTEVHAAIGIAQLDKMGELNEIRTSLADKLTRDLSEFDFLIPPVVEDNCTHVYYLFPMRFLEDRIGISRELFVKAMSAEGVAIAQGYVRPVYWEPMFQEKIAYGSDGCPFKCPLYSGQVSYQHGICPTVERLHTKEILTTDICKYPNSEKEINEFVSAVKKVVNNIEQLRKSLD